MSQPYLNTVPAAVVVSGRALITGENLVFADGRQPDSIGIVGFRFEHSTLTQQKSPGTLACSVELIEHAGAKAHVFVRLRDGEEFCVVRIASSTMRD